METLQELGYPSMENLAMDVIESHERLDEYGVPEGETLTERIRQMFVMFIKFAENVKQ